MQLLYATLGDDLNGGGFYKHQAEVFCFKKAFRKSLEELC